MKNRFGIVIAILILLMAFAGIAKADEPTYFDPTKGYDGEFHSSDGSTYEEWVEDYKKTFGVDPRTGEPVNNSAADNRVQKKTYIYSTASTSKQYRLTSLNKDASITVIGFSGKYAVIEYNGDKAYVLADNVSAKLQTVIKANVSIKTYVYTKINTGKKYRKQELAKGTELTLTARYGKWWEFTIDGQTLYIQSKYVSLPD